MRWQSTVESYVPTDPMTGSGFENGLAYSNARLPQALMRAGVRAGNEEMVSAGLEALDWLVTIQRCE